MNNMLIFQMPNYASTSDPSVTISKPEIEMQRKVPLSSSKYPAFAILGVCYPFK